MKALLLLALLVCCGSWKSQAQKLLEPSYSLKFIRAVHPDSVNKQSVLVLLQVIPTHPQDFKLIISAKITYRVGDEELRMVDLGRQTDGKIKVAIYGAGVKEKAPAIYSLLKDRVDFTKAPDSRILVFYFRNISESSISHMFMRYGLWESGNSDIRLEKDFEFAVE